MKNTSKKRIVLGITLGLSLVTIVGYSLLEDTNNVKSSHQNNSIMTTNNLISNKKIYKDLNTSYLPQYKDDNNICGIATDEDGNKVAIASNGACPASDVLMTKYGYSYTETTDDFRPTKDGDFCGYAHYIKEENRLGKADMAQLVEKVGDIDNISVTTDKPQCPNLSELSNFITNSIGVPIRFGYNSLNTNPNNYPVVEIDTSDFLESISMSENNDISILDDFGTSKIQKLDKNGKLIPRYMQNSEALDYCDGDYKNCLYTPEDKSLKIEGKEDIYEIKTHNGYILPDFLVRKGAWDVCQGVFTQCDFIPDEGTPQSGKLVNIVTGEEYHSPIPLEVTEIE